MPGRAEILALAREVGYLAPEGGRGPAARARITAVVPEADRWAFGSILTGVHEVLTAADAALTVVQGASGADRARLAGAPELYRDADAVMLVPLPEATLTELRRLRDRLVVAGSVVPGVPSVGIDDIEAGQKATMREATSPSSARKAGEPRRSCPGCGDRQPAVVGRRTGEEARAPHRVRTSPLGLTAESSTFSSTSPDRSADDELHGWGTGQGQVDSTETLNENDSHATCSAHRAPHPCPGGSSHRLLLTSWRHRE
ncbi:MAG: hypothetical protein ACK5LS_12175 [Propioniciclava sp.]